MNFLASRIKMTLITILSNNNIFELIPIIYEFKNRVKKHILIADKIDSSKVLELEKAINKLNKKYNLVKEIETVIIDEDDKQDIKKLQQNLPNSDLYINATKADNTLLVVLSVYVLNKNGYVISYDKFENTYNLISTTALTNHKIENNLNIDNFLLLCGYKVSYDIVDNQKSLHSDVKFIFKDTQKLFKAIQYYNQNKIEKIPKKILKAFRSIGLIKKNKIDKIYSFGYLFELFIYNKLDSYNFDDIKINVKVNFNDDILNEFDILTIKDNHIYAIECKFGTASEAENVIYKLDSIIEHFGEDSKGLIVNLQNSTDNKNKKPIKKLYSSIKTKRAMLNSIAIYNEYFFDEKKFNNLVSNFFNVVADSIKTTNQPIFLLGGYDLEMVEIKKILDEKEAFYIDRNLSWGAKLSDYADLLNDEQIFYGIELISDINEPKNYTLIDHHNEYQDRDSSIEQIAKIFDIKLNRFQQLVAINDKSYIGGMKKFGATEVEIEYIRKLDRASQGVREDDEFLAISSIEDAQKIGDIIVVNAYTDKFSPIIDRLLGKDVLIYNKDHITYYGKGVEKLVVAFKDELDKKLAYYGGNFGFFGFDLKNRPQNEVKKYKNSILRVLGAIK
jgi:hypothetical protein